MLRLAIPPEHVGHARYKYYAFLDPAQVPQGRVRDDLVAAMTALNMPCASGSCPEIYREDAFTTSSTRPGRRLPKAKALGETSLMLPVDHTFDDQAMRRLGETLCPVLSSRSEERRVGEGCVSTGSSRWWAEH